MKEKVFLLGFILAGLFPAMAAELRLMVASPGSDALITEQGWNPQSDTVVLNGTVTITDDPDEGSYGSVTVEGIGLTATAAYFPAGVILPGASVYDLTDLVVTRYVAPGFNYSLVGPNDEVNPQISLVISGNLTSAPALPFFGEPSGPHYFSEVAVPLFQGTYIRNVASDVYELALVSAPFVVEIDVPGSNPVEFEFVVSFNLLGGDIDGDGFQMEDDNCPGLPNASQADDDGDGIGDACDGCPSDGSNDGDGDGICGLVDNCPAYQNPGQEDQDGDGIGDPCDQDVDGDGFDKQDDNCTWTPNPGQQDTDLDGLGNACDNCPAAPNPAQEDTDTDGLGDACDPCPAPLAKLHPGDLLIADRSADPDATGPGLIFRLGSLNGVFQPYADSTSFATPVSVGLDPFGDLIVADRDADPFQTGTQPGTVYRIDPANCTLAVAGWHADWTDPVDLEVDPLGQVWLADETSAAIYRTRITGSTDVVLAKGFEDLHSISLRPGPSIFVSENDRQGAGKVYEYFPAANTTTEIDPGFFSIPTDLTTDGAGNEFVLDLSHNIGEVNLVDLAGGPTSMFATDPAWDEVRRTVLDDQGDLLVSNASKTIPPAIYSVDAAGAVSLLTDDAQLDEPEGMAVVGLPYVVTEPGFPQEINQLDPTTAFNRLKGEYLAVWEQQGNIYGRLIRSESRVDRSVALIFQSGSASDPGCILIPPLCPDPIPYRFANPVVAHHVHTVTGVLGTPISQSSQYLVVAELNYDNGRSGIWARRHGDDLTPLTPMFNLTPELGAFGTESAVNADPAVTAFPTSNIAGFPFSGNPFLAAWGKTASNAGDLDGIYGVVLDLLSPGAPAEITIVSGTTPRDRPAVAHGDDHLVLYQSGNRIASRRVDEAGTVIGVGEVLVSDTPLTAVGAREPAVAYNETSDEFLAVWTENRTSPAEIMARLFDSAGFPQGGTFVVDANPDVPGNLFDGRPSLAPAVAASGTAGEWFVAYEEYQENGTIFADPRGLFGRRVDVLGAGDEIPLMQKAHGNFDAALAHDAGRDEFLLLFEHDYDASGTDFDIWGRLLENTDLDSRPDVEDNCPRIANSAQDNADNDAFGDLCDPFPFDAGNDHDADGIGGDVDNCLLIPNGPNGGTCIAGLLTGGSCDTDPDCAAGTTPGVCSTDQGDLDGDTLGDACDADRDGDGVNAGPDCNDLDAAAFPGNPEACDGIDNDCDGIIDSATLPGVSDGFNVAGFLSWNPVPGAMTVDLIVGDLGRLRLFGGDFSLSIMDCVQDDYPGNALNYGPDPVSGEAWYFLLRGSNCLGNGTYDTGAPGQVAPRDAAIAASGRDCL